MGLKFIGMQVVIEGLALAAFNAAKESTNDPVFKRMLEQDGYVVFRSFISEDLSDLLNFHIMNQQNQL